MKDETSGSLVYGRREKKRVNVAEGRIIFAPGRIIFALGSDNSIWDTFNATLSIERIDVQHLVAQ